MRLRIGAVLALGSALLVAAPALAQESEEMQPVADPVDAPDADAEVVVRSANPRLPLRRAARPITMPANMLRLSVFTSGANRELAFGDNDFIFSLQLGGGYSITDDLEVGIDTERVGVVGIAAGRTARSGWRPTGEGLFSFIVADEELDFGDIPIYARYRFWHTDLIEIGAEVGVVIPTYQASDFALRMGVPVRLHAGEVFAFDTGIFTSMTFGDDPSSGDPDDDFWGALFVPVRAVISPVDWLSFAISSGLNTGPFDGDFFAIPLGMEVVAAFPMGTQSLLDLVAGFEWPALLRPATDDSDRAEPSTWVLSAGARLYFALGDG